MVDNNSGVDEAMETPGVGVSLVWIATVVSSVCAGPFGCRRKDPRSGSPWFVSAKSVADDLAMEPSVGAAEAAGLAGVIWDHTTS